MIFMVSGETQKNQVKVVFEQTTCLNNDTFTLHITELSFVVRRAVSLVEKAALPFTHQAWKLTF